MYGAWGWRFVAVGGPRGARDLTGGATSGFGGCRLVGEGVGEGGDGGVGVGGGHVLGPRFRESADQVDAGADVLPVEEVARAGDGPAVDFEEGDEGCLRVVEVVVEEALLVLGDGGEGGGHGIGGGGVGHGEDSTPAAWGGKG